MILDKALLLKCLGGLTACSGVIGVGVVGHKKGWWSSSKGNTQVETAETLITNSGLSCTFGDSNNTNEGECTSVATDKKINVKHDKSTKKEGITSIDVSGSTKIKVQKETSEGSYNKKVKLTIEGGDITLTGGSGSQTISKLEQFETYEIVKEGGKYYLSRKEGALDEVRRNLGLPEDCSLILDTTTTSKTCTIPSDKIKDINFDGKSQSEPTNNSSSNLTLTISKTSASEDYPYGLNFSFKSSSGDVTITTTSTPSITIKSTEDSEFKIKKDGNDVKLEKTSTLSTITSKVGITCDSSDNTCSLNTTGKINVKKDQKLEIDASSTAPTEKIKVYSGTDATGYENGFKFAIEDGDITVGSGSTNKLEQFETYEIVKDGEKWYLNRKTDALEGKSKALGLPTEDSTCKLPSTDNSPTTCQLDEAKLKKINFDGKNGDGATIENGETGTITLKITKTSDTTTYPNGGYKFVFETDKNITISSSSSNKIMKNTNTEFKIKETTSSGSAKTLSLEKAWTVTTLAQKVGLTNCATTTGSSKECNLPTSETNLKLYNSSEDKTENGKASSSSQKIKYEEDVEGHNQGFKFYVDEEVTLSEPSNKKIEKDNATYEIKEIGGQWYLAKKTTGQAAS